MTDILWKSAHKLHQMMCNKHVSPVEVLGATFKRLDEVEPKLSTFLEVTEKQTRAAAKAAEKTIMSGSRLVSCTVCRCRLKT